MEICVRYEVLIIDSVLLGLSLCNTKRPSVKQSIKQQVSSNLAEEPSLADGHPSTTAEIPWIPVHKTWQMNLLWPIDPPGTRAEMPWIPVHKTWQMNLLWPMGPTPQATKQRCLEYQYTKLGRWTYFGRCTPQVTEQRCLEYQYTKLGR